MLDEEDAIATSRVVPAVYRYPVDDAVTRLELKPQAAVERDRTTIHRGRNCMDTRRSTVANKQEEPLVQLAPEPRPPPRGRHADGVDIRLSGTRRRHKANQQAHDLCVGLCDEARIGEVVEEQTLQEPTHWPSAPPLVSNLDDGPEVPGFQLAELNPHFADRGRPSGTSLPYAMASHDDFSRQTPSSMRFLRSPRRGGLDSNQRRTDNESADCDLTTSTNRHDMPSDRRFCCQSLRVSSRHLPCTRGPNEAACERFDPNSGALILTVFEPHRSGWGLPWSSLRRARKTVLSSTSQLSGPIRDHGEARVKRVCISIGPKQERVELPQSRQLAPP